MSTAPAFQFYPADFIVGTAEMSPEEVGAYIRLLCYQWSKGGLPDDQAKCASMAGCSGNAIASIWHKFGRCEDGRMRNTRMEAVRAEQDKYRAKQADNAKKRWKKDGLAMPPHIPPDMPDACPSSSPSNDQTNKRASVGEWPSMEDFLAFFLPDFVSYPDFPADAYLRARYSDFDSTGWKKGLRDITNWRGLGGSLARDYRNDREKSRLGGNPNGARYTPPKPQPKIKIV